MCRNGMSYKDAGYLGYLVSKKTHQDMYKTRIEEYQKLGYNTKFILDKVEVDLYSITE